MSSRDDLARKLAALARRTERYRDGARVLSEGGYPPLLQAILAEIDDTVSTRNLEMRLGDRACLVAVAAGRRLLGFRRLDGVGRPGEAEALVDRPLSPEATDTVEALCRLLAPLAEGDGALTVVSRPATRLGTQSDAGLKVADLAARFGLAYPFPTPSPMLDFRGALGARAIAAIRYTAAGDVVEEGDPEALTLLQRCAASGALPGSNVGDTPGPVLSSLGRLRAGGPMLTLARTDHEALLWAHDPADLGHAVRLWRAMAEPD